MPTLHLEFISDIACPWCAVGLNSLEWALAQIGDDIDITLHFQPFELNPQMPAEGADAVRYLCDKYGITPEQVARNQAAIRQRGTEVGFTFGTRSHVWNTFDAHRLLYWAGLRGAADAGHAEQPAPAGAQRALKHALLQAYHGQGRNPSDPAVLVELAAAAGLDAARAAAVLAEGRYADEVREAEARWQGAGIQSVPSLVINGRHLIQGGQPPEVFERALRQVAADSE
jgi:predicted DsbA family dithiol-disulfide isomerase